MKKIFRITALVLLLTFSLSLLTGCMNGFLKDFFEKYFGKISELPIPGSSSSFVSEPVGSSSEVTSSGIVSSSVVPEPEPDPVITDDRADAPTAIEDPSYSPDIVVSFENMPYNQLSATRISQRLKEIGKLLRIETDHEKIDELVNEAEQLIGDYNYAFTLAMIRSDLDPSDEYWNAEYDYLRDHYYSQISIASTAFLKDLYHSPEAKYISEEFDIAIPDDPDAEPDYDEEALSRLNSKLSKLLGDYSDMVSMSTITYHGEEYTYYEINALSDPYAYKDAQAMWLDEYNPKLAEIYIELVKTRTAIARLMGYDDYLDYLFNSEGYSYTPEMASQLIDNIIKYVVPEFSELKDIGYIYGPEVDVPFDEFMKWLKDAFKKMGDNFTGVLDILEKYGLYDYEARKYKKSEYTIYIDRYEVPFMMTCYKRDFSSIQTFIHEFGHSYEQYMSYNRYDDDVDMSEIFSQTLELLVSRHFDLYFDIDTTQMLQYDALSSICQTLPGQAFFTLFEFEAYSMNEEELTVENLNKLARKCAEKLDLYNEDYPDSYARNWVTVSHIFDTPVYTFSYVTSASVALQIWKISRTNEQKALETYDKLITASSTSFLDIIKEAGLKSPFEEETMKDIGRIINKYLVNESWGE